MNTAVNALKDCIIREVCVCVMILDVSSPRFAVFNVKDSQRKVNCPRLVYQSMMFKVAFVSFENVNNPVL